jgi:hypothetical protein
MFNFSATDLTRGKRRVTRFLIGSEMSFRDMQVLTRVVGLQHPPCSRFAVENNIMPLRRS